MSSPPTTPSRIEAIFRREAARLISVLTRIFGPHNLELAEDVVQEAFVAALEVWSDRGIPDNPAAWLLSSARNRAIDAIRRERTRRTFAPDLALYLDSEWTVARTVDDAFGEDGIRDDQLRTHHFLARALERTPTKHERALIALQVERAREGR